jgi:predicted aldo/keto reductase-like oxidoreductase
MREEFNNELPQQNIDYGDFKIIDTIKKSKYHKITRMIPKEKFTYIDHNHLLIKNKTIQNTYVIIISTKKEFDTSFLLSYNFF